MYAEAGVEKRLKFHSYYFLKEDYKFENIEGGGGRLHITNLWLKVLEYFKTNTYSRDYDGFLL